MTASRRVLFLPGASGDGRFWHPVAERLPGGVGEDVLRLAGARPRSRPVPTSAASPTSLGWSWVEAGAGPVDLVAQSMGGVVAMMVALARPERVRRIVLTATSAGIDITPFAPEDWRPEYAQEFPGAAPWILTERPNLSARLPSVMAPTLLVWSDADPISPLGVGRRLAGLLPRAELAVLPVAGHMFARDHANIVAPNIERHLSAGEV